MTEFPLFVLFLAFFLSLALAEGVACLVLWWLGHPWPRRQRRRIRIVWTCSDCAHHEHRWRWSAWLCGRGQWCRSGVKWWWLADRLPKARLFDGTYWRLYVRGSRLMDKR